MPKKGGPDLTSREAQREHESLASQPSLAAKHMRGGKVIAAWRACPGCLKRFRQTGVTVDGKSV